MSSKEDIPICPSCNREMELDEDFGINKSKKRKGGTAYRIRRFICSLCNITDTKFGQRGSDQYHEFMAEKELKEIERNINW